MANIKRATNKPMSRVRDLSTATKILITGNGSGAVAGRIRKDLDAFIDDLEALDAAVWKIIHQNKDRLYKFLEMLEERDKNKGDGPMSELKTAWTKFATSAETLAHDAQQAASQLRRKTGTN